MMAAPLVSVIIPTIRRPLLVQRAVRSVLAQTYTAIEIIVVIDGYDPATAAALAAVADLRLRVLQNPVSRGAGPARNEAAGKAAGDWIAFLDDDDEWLPDKLDRQLAGHGADENVLLSCRCQVHTPSGAHIWPRRLPRDGQAIDDYLFGRRSWLRGEAYIATPTLVLPRRLFAATRFGITHQNEDTTLILRVTNQAGARLVMLADVLVVIHADNPADSLGSEFAWRESLDWIDSMGGMISRTAYSGFCLVTLGSQAARQRDGRAVLALLRRAIRRGAPTFVQLGLFAGFWLLSERTRTGLRRIAARITN